ncbi:MAG: GNAT family N-acetyltransferase [Ignavibacteriales bacterium]|nr:GNAT family N-acetyltransferase [Ignavibacteriales bacterium]MCB9218904.1 GNAT family N-acetyltransferase [Ignavibacteriales bacterium]
MNDLRKTITSEINLNTLAKTIYDESIQMGFKSNDYVKLMNQILEMTISDKNKDEEGDADIFSVFEEISDLPIQTKHLTIRLYNPKTDKKIISNWFNEENNKLFLVSTTRKQNLNIDNFITDEKNIFATITLKDNSPIGLLAILNIDKENSKGEMRKMIGEVNQRGKGYATEATKYWLKYCTDFIGLKKIYINTIETNIKNITLNRKLGFKVEGLLKREIIFDNIEQDVLLMAYFKE